MSLFISLQKLTIENSLLFTQQQLSVMCEICFEFLIFQRNNVSSQRSLVTQCLAFQTSEMGDTHVYFIKPVAPTPRFEKLPVKKIGIGI